MKIIAVIPVCGGSVIFPNKNIRIVNGKPLIYYVINNAKKSKYITDIIVTTNSSEIINIAKQMGVKSKLRDDKLCNINVSLDTVVFDIFKDIDITPFDYVITMQSISPTLKSETLDKAIEECFTKGYDTSISVSATHRFYWEKEDKSLYPLHSDRVNRYKLKPIYVETGAFLITKSCFITERSRIGGNVNLFELSEDESVDVYSFGDLKQVENILCRKSTAIYVNGNSEIGLGHIYRITQLADELFTKPDIYFDVEQTDISVFGNTTHNLIPVKGKKELYEKLKKNQYDIFINDILSTSREYMDDLKKCLPNARIVNFEDEGNGAIMADIVFNALYETQYLPNVRAGEKYFIASKLFLLHDPIKIKEKVKNVLISFGGADPQNYTEQLFRIISQNKYKNINFYVVIGKVKKNVDSILSYNQYGNIKAMHNIDNMAEVMSMCDMAITSRGRTGYELVFLGIPTISIAQNCREELHTFLREENGVKYLGFKPSEELIENTFNNYLFSTKEDRKNIQRKMLAKDLRNGRKNVMNIIMNL